ncbi:hypothetical protein DFJ74DRAFT_704690 [Hyaloraphidium curvatum]|nr:hypothetical protein DFJ74DRAFT_704690 [Hyaloraphidium curvatum]
MPPPSPGGAAGSDDVVLPTAKDDVLAVRLGDCPPLDRAEVAAAEAAMRRLVRNELPDRGLDFDAFKHSFAELYGIVLGMFFALGIATRAPQLEVLLAFLRDVALDYRPNPYHSWYHAVDVTYMVFHSLTEFGVGVYLSRAEMCALLLSAVAHDVLHPGKNNLFQINAGAEVAKRYNGISVLENQSIDHSFALMRKHDLLAVLTLDEVPELDGTLMGVSPNMDGDRHSEASDGEDRQMELGQLVEELFVSAILYTDMKSHFQLQDKLEKIIEQADADEDAPDDDAANEEISPFFSDIDEIVRVNSDAPVEVISVQARTAEIKFLQSRRRKSMEFEQRKLLTNAILHAADISNAARPWTLCKKWSDFVVQEFFQQGDAERELGLTISPNMDRYTADQYSISIGFIDFLCKPFYEVLADLLPGMAPLVENLHANRNRWAELQAKEKEEKERLEKENADRESITSPSSALSVPMLSRTTTSGGEEVLLSPGVSEQVPNVLKDAAPLKVAIPVPPPARKPEAPIKQSSGEDDRGHNRRFSAAAGTIELPDQACGPNLAGLAMTIRNPKTGAPEDRIHGVAINRRLSGAPPRSVSVDVYRSSAKAEEDKKAKQPPEGRVEGPAGN